MANTMPRSIRVPGPIWKAAVEKAAAEGTTVTAVVVGALERYLNRCITCGVEVKQLEHRALNGEWALLWTDAAGAWVCPETGDEHAID